MSVGMFSIIPVPFAKWDDNSAKLILPFFPVVGGIIGGIWFGVACLLQRSDLPVMLISAIVMLLPLILSGFLHVEGLMDTADAVFSRRELTEKRRILKDPHVGSFAVIALAVFFVLSFTSVYTIIVDSKSIFSLLFIPIVSRSVAGIAILKLKLISDSGYAASLKKITEPIHLIVLVIPILLSFLLIIVLKSSVSFVSMVSLIITACLVTLYTYKQLDGISGDLCGCIITVSELGAILTLSLI